MLLGIDVLEAQGYALLKGKQVGLITNQTGKDSQGRSTADLLARAPGVKLVAPFLSGAWDPRDARGRTKRWGHDRFKAASSRLQPVRFRPEADAGDA